MDLTFSCIFKLDQKELSFSRYIAFNSQKSMTYKYY